MSARALRRLQRDRDLAATPTTEDVSSSDDDTPPPAKPSLFALLGAENDDDDDGDDDESEPEVESKPAQEKPAPTAAKKKSKKSKKKRKAAKDAHEDDLDKALRELKIEPVAATPLDVKVVRSILAVDPKMLDAKLEMRKLFGRAVMDDGSVNAADAAAGQGGRHQRGIIAGKTFQASRPPRRNLFVQPKDEWPQDRIGLSMEALKDRSFKFTHSLGYQDTQRQFLLCVQSHDPQRLMMMLQHNPYHISTLLQVSEIFAHQRDHTEAGDLLERGMFAFGRIVHSKFTEALGHGTVRMDFQRPENREFWLCCWRYIKNLGQRGTWRTTLEYAKMLLQLDPVSDPYGLSLMVDFLALKSRQAEWLVEFAASGLIPNDLPNIPFSTALAYRQLNKDALAEEMLLMAITKFPWIPRMVFAQIGVEDWTHSVLWGAMPPEGNERQQVLGTLYAHRTKDIWKESDSASFLQETCEKIFSLPRRPPLGNAEPTVSLDLARHCLLSDIPEVVTELPRSITTRSTSSFDPLAPEEQIRSYVLPEETRSVVPGDPREGQSAIRALLESLMPWYNAGGEGGNGPALDQQQLNGLREALRAQGVDLPPPVFEPAGEDERRIAVDSDGEELEEIEAERRPEGE